MPAKKIKKTTKNVATPKSKDSATVCCSSKSLGKKLLATLIGILIVYLIFYVGTLINNNLKKNQYIGFSEQSEKTILITGYGKVVGTNNIAVVGIGYSNEDKDVAIAQAKNKKVMGVVLEDLKKMGINGDDIVSDYSIYPQYKYSSSSKDKTKEFVGYQVTHQLTVKIRDLKNITGVLNLSTKYGINKISGIKFAVDDKENLKDKARMIALKDAQKKAKEIATTLGVSIVKVSSYHEYEVNSAKSYYEGVGGLAQDVASGSSPVEMNVNITYVVK